MASCPVMSRDLVKRILTWNMDSQASNVNRTAVSRRYCTLIEERIFICQTECIRASLHGSTGYSRRKQMSGVRSDSAGSLICPAQEVGNIGPSG